MRYLDLAHAVAQNAKCCRRKVGAVLVGTDGKVFCGANGSVVGDCKQGSCIRCQDESLGLRYDLCQCAHAEEVVIIGALKAGYDTTGGRMYVTLQPCVSCLRIMILAKLSSFVFEIPVDFPVGFQRHYDDIVKGAGMHYEQQSSLG